VSLLVASLLWGLTLGRYFPQESSAFRSNQQC
jgi:hypothetical protein